MSSRAKISSMFSVVHHVAKSGVLLLIATIAALVIANTSCNGQYHHILEQNISFIDLNLSIHSWINDLLMSIFFLGIGIEIKHEWNTGSLSTNSQRIAPMICAIGGVVVPIIIYLFFNVDTPYDKGWAIPCATDIAFTLSLTAFIGGNKISKNLKIFLMAIAIIDDLIAIIIIALFYTNNIDLTYVIYAFIIITLLFLKKFDSVFVYLSLGAVLWYLFLKSGIHPTVAGVILGFIIPKSLAKSVEKLINPLVIYFILPIFAFSNGGLRLQDDYATLINSVSLGIVVGLFIGKQLGIFTTIWLLLKCKIYTMPPSSNIWQFYALSILCGIGFTMSLFIGTLSFDPQHMQSVQFGVLAGSLLSAVIGAIILKISTRGN